ncbi:DUF5906 domain-containing protein [Lachnospiraceae bacterium 29-84]
MVDFLMVSTRSTKRGVIEIYPKFIIKKSKDLMIRGGDFYAIWVERRGLWSTDEQDALQMIDYELDCYVEENRQKFNSDIRVLHMWDAESGMIDSWHKYCQRQMRDSFHMLDEKLIFSNMETRKEDYASKKLPYPLEPGNTPAYDKLMATLYSPEERHKVEWAIGSIVCGESKKLQKFMVLYGAMGTGKSTVLNIIQQLFDGYCAVFSAKDLGSASNTFALEPFRTNPLVAIEHDGDLSRIEDNTRLNSLVSHEMMTVNEKFKSAYSNRFKCFLFVGTNKPVKITDAKSGLIRRLVDVSPSGNKLPVKEYEAAVSQAGFELGAIAWRCQQVYWKNPGIYDNYIPVAMLGASNDFYNFMEDSYHVFKKADGTSLTAAWAMYKAYCEDARIVYPLRKMLFQEELKNYFREYSKERVTLEDGTRPWNYYSGFRTEKFKGQEDGETQEGFSNFVKLECIESIFDKECEECPAQYATSKETPLSKWDVVKTTLSQLDTSRLHYVKVPENHIVIDFDIKDEHGRKSMEKNIEAAGKWPPTYAELSKSGEGLHLHYIYAGDVSGLSRVYDDQIEIKVFSGKSSLRRKLTKCNNLPFATISSGLPLKGGKKMVDFDAIKSEKGLRKLIKRNLNKEIHPGTKPSIDFIYKILEDAYASGLGYDVTDMRNAVLAFAANSTNQSDYCVKIVDRMRFKSEDATLGEASQETEMVFYDVEVFPNLFLVNWKVEGEGKPVVRMINPSPTEIEGLMRMRLVGFNCRRYDNHILYARMMGYDNAQLYRLSQRIISGSPNCYFGEAYHVSYTDVYDFASAGNKKSLKKLEIEMGIHHQELGFPWDEPVPEEQWVKVAEYCDNDVVATEAAFHYLSADWTARQILADLAGMRVNDTTNTLTTRIIFGVERNPQGQFHYRDLSQPVYGLDEETYQFLVDAVPGMMGQKHGDAGSLLPYFPGYKFEGGKSIYQGEEVGEGGYVYAEPGMYGNVALLDIASMHPHSVIAEVLFGMEFTKRFKEIVDGRVSIKHEDWDTVNHMLNGKLSKYIQRVADGKLKSKQLADALKTAINSVYGLTSANFENPFRDSRNKDNIVAKRGALFMIDLKHEVQKRGFTVAHIKTDSIKIPNATPGIIQFVMEFGKKYGYTFEHEATYDRMCLVNEAVYIAKYKDGDWTATGAQFAVPYVFKKLFSKEKIVFDDMCETKSASTALYLDMNENLRRLTANEGKELGKIGKEYDISHNYIFVGKVGRFCPVREGHGGGVLLRAGKDKEGNPKYTSVTGTKGYRWLEAEMVKELGKESNIDQSYYISLVDSAIETISKYGDFERFVSEEPYSKTPDFMDIPEGAREEIPFNYEEDDLESKGEQRWKI